MENGLRLPRWRAALSEPEELRGVAWREAQVFTSYGLRIGVRVDETGFLEKLQPHLPPLWKPSRSAVVDKLYSVLVRRGASLRSSLRHRLYADAEVVAEFVTVKSLLDLLESQLQLYVAEFAPGRVFIHAGVVGWRGKAIVIPGRSFTGKTSLVAELVRAGATYYSDEYAVLDERGIVSPYPRKLSIRTRGKVIRAVKREAEELGGRTGRKPLPIGLVVVSEYREGGRFRPRQLSAGEGVLALLNNTLSVRRQPEVALATVTRAIAGARLIKSPRGEAAEIAADLLALLL